MKPVTSPLRGLEVVLLCLSTALLTSCSASYKATRVTPLQVTTEKPGIYYSLPKTELLVLVGVKKTTKKAGVYGGDAWNDCKKICFDPVKYPLAQCSVAAKPAKVTYELTSVKSFSRVVADPEHLYHVNVNLKAFAAFSHTFKLSNEGILASSTSEIENKGVEVAINTTAALLKLAPLIKLAPPPPVKPMTEAERTNACDEFRKDFALQEDLDRKVDELRGKLDAVLFRSPAPEGPAIEQLIKRHEARVGEVRASKGYEKLMEDRADASKEEALGDYAVRIIPPEFAKASASEADWLPVQQMDKEGYAAIEATPAKEGDIKTVLEELKRMKLTVSVDPQFGFAADNADRGGDRTGYRYRFPAAADVKVSRAFDYVDKDGAQQESIQPIAAFRTLVAQYGAVTAMPSKISGVKSKIMLDLYGSTGSPRQVDIGATPLPSSTFADALAPVQTELERRKTEKEEKKKELDNTEMDSLTKERDLMKLKKEIAELEKALEATESE